MKSSRSVAVAVAVGTHLFTALAHAGSKDACIAAADRGQDLRDHDRLQAARQEFLACAADACPAVVRKLCVQWESDVELRMPSVVFTATSGGQAVTDVRVLADGAPLLERIEGTAVPMDPGPHAFRFERTGVAPIERKVVVREGEKFQRVDVAFEAPTPGPAPVPSAPIVPPAAPAEAPKEGTPGSPLRIVGLVAAGAGAVALGVGTYLGLHAKAVYDSASAHCPTSSTCDPTGVSDGESAHHAATVSTVLFATGGVLLVGGAVLYFALPPASGGARALRVAPLVGRSGGGAVVVGAW